MSDAGLAYWHAESRTGSPLGCPGDECSRSTIQDRGGPTYHLSVACHHCEIPPCAKACPSGALEKGKDGLVLLDPDRCLGCRYCEMACPFGAPSFDEESGVMTKCHLCNHRLEEKLPPACVLACPTGALGIVLSDPEATEVEAGAERPLVPGVRIPGFGDPAHAGPGFWVAEPTGAIRSAWFAELAGLLGPKTEGPHDPA